VNANTPFTNSSTPGDNFSDYIGRIGFTYQPVSVAYRFAFDSDTLATDRSEVTLNFYKPWLSFSLAYRLVDYYQLVDNATVFNDNQEGSLDVTLPLDSEWSLYSGARRDFDLGQMVSADAGVIYKNECFNVTLAGLRTYARDRDVTPSSSFTVTVGFKNLGEFGGK
jgi:lipopolysaccharide assembly outer membrane protein LptD (OstA)